MKRALGLLLCGLGLLFAVPHVQAADDPPVHAPLEVPTNAVPTVSVLQCLKNIHDPDSVPLMIVRAKEINVPTTDLADGEMPATLDQIHNTFHLVRQRLGSVAALVPDTKTEISLEFPPIDPYANLTSSRAFTLLAASLEDRQWSSLTSATGLAYDELNTADQKYLWTLCFGYPGRLLLKPEPVAQPGNPNNPAEDPGVDVTDKINSIRMRLQRTVTLYRADENGGPNFPDIRPTVGPLYSLTQVSGEMDSAKRAPVVVSLNSPKPTDLDFSDHRLDGQLSISAGVTVGQLINRIAAVSNLRLFCNPDYESYSVYAVGERTPLRAGDILQAICLSLTGTVRRVGRDYSLTNDRVGFGTKKAIVDEYLEHLANAQHIPEDAASDKLRATHPPESIPTRTGFGDPEGIGELTTSEQKLIASGSLTISIPGSSNVKIPITDLTSPQREYLDTMYAPDRMFGGQKPPPTKTALFMAYNQVIMTIPGIPGEGQVSGLFPWRLYTGSGAEVEARIRKYQSGVRTIPDPADLSKVLPELPLRKIFQTVGDRALIVSSTSEAETLEMLGLAKDLGFNHVWLDLFSETFSQIDAQRGSRQLLAAIYAGKKLGIQVSPIVDLLHTTHDPTQGSEITIRGETAGQQTKRIFTWYAENGLDHPYLFTQYNFNGLSPSHPASWNRFQNIASALGASPDIPTPILAAAGMPGYDSSAYTTDFDFGYVLRNRVGFLELTRVDPIDIPPTSDDTFAGLLPLFSMRDANKESALRHEWSKYRFNVLNRFLRLLLSGYSRNSDPLLIEDIGRDTNGWFGSWDSPTAALPHYSAGEIGTNTPVYSGDDAIRARMQSRFAYVKVNVANECDLAYVTYRANRALLHRHWKAAALNLDPNLYGDGQFKGTSLQTLRSLKKELADSENGMQLTNGAK